MGLERFQVPILPLLPFFPLSPFLGVAERFGDPLLSRFLSLGDLLLDSFEEDLEPFLPEPGK